MFDVIVARRRIAVLVGLILFALALLTSQVRSADRRHVGPLGTAVLTLLLPIQAGMAHLADAGTRWWRLYTEIGRLRQENARLRSEVERLSQDLTVIREQAISARRMERLLELRPQPGYRAVAARVIARDPERWFSTLLVDRGSRDGVRRNAAVATADGVIGRVIEVTPTAARVLLIGDSRSALSVLVQRSREAGIVEGRGGEMLHLKYLSRTGDVAGGDLVVTSGLGGVFPRGLVVGRIVTINREPGTLQLEAEVKSAASVARLEEVVILVAKP